MSRITMRPGDRIYLIFCKFGIYLSQAWRKWAVAVIAILIILIGGFFAGNLKVGDTTAGKAIFYPDHPYNAAYDKLNSDFVGASGLIVIAEGKNKGAMKDPRSLNLLEDFKYYVQDLPNIGGVLTVVDMIKRSFQMMHDGDPKWFMMPVNPLHVETTIDSLAAMMGAGEFDRFISTPDYTHASVTMFLREYNNVVVKDTISDLKSYIKGNQLDTMEFRLAGGILGILAAVNEEVEWSYWVNLALIFTTTFFLCSAAFRSFLAAFILIVPLAMSQVLSELLMLIWGIDLNINSLPVAAVGVGVGVDYGIYILGRLGEEYVISDDYPTARYLAITSTGKAVVFTATTLVVGVIFWVFSSFKFQAEMGILLAFLMVANMIGALVVVPSLVSIFGPKTILKKYYA